MNVYFTFGQLFVIIICASWFFLDLLIMMTSLGLTFRFRQINLRLKKSYGRVSCFHISYFYLDAAFVSNRNYYSNKAMPDSFWIEIRSHYLSLVELIRIVDDKLSLIILLSCANNMYFICVQLYYSFQ